MGVPRWVIFVGRNNVSWPVQGILDVSSFEKNIDCLTRGGPFVTVEVCVFHRVIQAISTIHDQGALYAVMVSPEVSVTR